MKRIGTLEIMMLAAVGLLTINCSEMGSRECKECAGIGSSTDCEVGVCTIFTDEVARCATSSETVCSGNVPVHLSTHDDSPPGASEPRPFQVAIDPPWLLVTDLNMDGEPDLVRTDEELAMSRRLAVSIAVGDTMVPVGLVELGGFPGALAAGQLDDDGMTDLLVTLPEERRTLVLFGDGNGGFPRRSLVEHDDPAAVALPLDYDGDELGDIVFLQDLAKVTYSGLRTPSLTLEPGLARDGGVAVVQVARGLGEREFEKPVQVVLGLGK